MSSRSSAPPRPSGASLPIKVFPLAVIMGWLNQNWHCVSLSLSPKNPPFLPLQTLKDHSHFSFEFSFGDEKCCIIKNFYTAIVVDRHRQHFWAASSSLITALQRSSRRLLTTTQAAWRPAEFQNCGAALYASRIMPPGGKRGLFWAVLWELMKILFVFICLKQFHQIYNICSHSNDH